MLNEEAIRQLLAPYEIRLTSEQVSLLQTYLDLLLRWNKKINLTSIRTERECITRHFGESLCLARHLNLRGSLLDVGSGAGFPGLALRIAFPELSTTLLEPVGKKRAFLKEVARACNFESVEVRPERLEDFIRLGDVPRFGTVTSRAVGHLETLLAGARQALQPGGRICLWLSRSQRLSIAKTSAGLEWSEPIRLPFSQEGEICVGKERSGCFDHAEALGR